MIRIDMSMPENCRMCPVCSEYDICLIPVDGKGFGEQNVSEFTEGRPEWCPLKEQEAVEPKEIVDEHFPIGDFRRTIGWLCGKCGEELMGAENYCSNCGQAVKWE